MLDWDQRLPFLVVCGAAGGLFAAVILGAALLLGKRETPYRRGLVHWLPIAAAGITCAALGRADMAVAIAFGTSVALLTTVVGFVTFMGAPREMPAAWQRLWLFGPVACLLTFIIGFRGFVGWTDVIALLTQGAIVVWLVGGSGGEEDELPTIGRRDGRAVLLVASAGATLIVALAVVAAWAGVRGAVDLHRLAPRYPPSVVAGAFLGIALALPMISTGSPLAARGQASLAMTSQLVVVLLNFCLLVPLLMVTTVVTEGFEQIKAIFGGEGDVIPRVIAILSINLDYPRPVWRIDAVVSLLAAMLLAPVGLGRIRLDRTIAAGLIVGYCFYLAAMVVFGGMS